MNGTKPSPVLASLALPPIDRLPSMGMEPNVLEPFVRRRARSWGGVPTPLSAAVTAALWILLALDVAFGGWLLAVRAGTAPCSGFVCSVATIGDHPLLAVVLTGVCATALIVSVLRTRGLSRASGPQLGLIVVGAVTGVVALSGVAAVLIGAALCLVVAFGVFAAVVNRL
jgi:hypothetical protein